MKTKPESKIISFSSADKLERWWEKNHGKSNGIWIKFYKKSSGIKTVTYPEAVDLALCFGWIDSQLKSLDEKAYLQKFTPRRSKSVWSKINTAKIEKLIAEKKMRPAGLKVVEEAKQDGRWANAYHSPSTAKMPRDFLLALNKNKKAKQFFKTLKKANTYAIFFRIQSAKKSETRKNRIKDLVKMLAKSQKPHLI